MAVLAAFIPYVLLMSFIWAGKIKTDKEIYRPGEVAIITILSEGYLFSPRIIGPEVRVEGYRIYEVPPNVHTNSFRVVHTIRAASNAATVSTYRTYIKAIYMPQVLPFKREHYEEFTIVP